MCRLAVSRLARRDGSIRAKNLNRRLQNIKRTVIAKEARCPEREVTYAFLVHVSEQPQDPLHSRARLDFTCSPYTLLRDYYANHPYQMGLITTALVSWTSKIF